MTEQTESALEKAEAAMGRAPDPALINAKRLGMVVDLNRCVGCWTCAVACKEENDVGIGLYWLRVLTIGGDENIDVPSGTFPDVSLAYQSTNCFHCDNPPCTKACPTQATYKMANGIVVVNWDRCIGCRYCMVACPYDNRVFNWRKPVQEPPADVAVVGEVAARPKGVVEKCTFCVHRVTKGYLPRCVIACPTGARIFGDLADPNSEVSTIVRERPTYTVFPELGTEPSVHYVLREGPNDAGGEL
jgi:molybdopterin-containing oxidoreductase family iron-sulfur binding subunit